MQPFTFFISYRRRDTAPIALLLKYEIEKRLEFVRVFIDVEKNRIGEEFPDRIVELIDKAHATIALIVKTWMPNNEEPAKTSETTDLEDKNVDWIVKELSLSKDRQIDYDEINLYGLSKRKVFPIFVDCPEKFDKFQIPKEIAYIKQLQGPSIDFSSWPRSIGQLVKEIAEEAKLKIRSEPDKYPPPDPAKGRTQALPDSELKSILKYDAYDGWYIDNFGEADVRYLVKTFKFNNFNQAAEFMNDIASHCRVLAHHPEWRNVFGHVTVSLTTWDAKRRVTIYDMNLAMFMNKVEKLIKKKRL